VSSDVVGLLVLVQPYSLAEDREDADEYFSRYSCWTILLKATTFPKFISLTGYGAVFERVKVMGRGHIMSPRTSRVRSAE
jgi:hypothetical protein